MDEFYRTGTRQSTERMHLEWRRMAWYDMSARYFRLWGSRKTWPRWLIAKYECKAALERLHLQQPDIARMAFDAVLAEELALKVFRFAEGARPHKSTHVFRRLVQELDIGNGTGGATRSRDGLRHSDVTESLLSGMDIHILARQMGTSVLMLERRYSKLTSTLAADRSA